MEVRLLSPADAWALLRDDPAATLVDVRTKAEWFFVGVPDLRSLAKTAVNVSWQVFPQMTFNPAFADQVAEQVPRGTHLIFISRSGNRSSAAAAVLAKRGWTCSDVADGFEGPPDQAGHRGSVAGWQASGLPWIQA
jgi:rhodanese-related sulfurtransferase